MVDTVTCNQDEKNVATWAPPMRQTKLNAANRVHAESCRQRQNSGENLLLHINERKTGSS